MKYISRKPDPLRIVKFNCDATLVISIQTARCLNYLNQNQALFYQALFYALFLHLKRTHPKYFEKKLKPFLNVLQSKHSDKHVMMEQLKLC